jgi:hypothetical protein
MQIDTKEVTVCEDVAIFRINDGMGAPAKPNGQLPALPALLL